MQDTTSNTMQDSARTMQDNMQATQHNVVAYLIKLGAKVLLRQQNANGGVNVFWITASCACIHSCCINHAVAASLKRV
jgi:hypothetical protein